MSNKDEVTVVKKVSIKVKEGSTNIVKFVWEFMNKSPILSAIILSIVAILGSQGYKLYVYIYWLPYFKLFEVPTYYFEDAVFDKYELLLDAAPKVLVVIFLFIFFGFLEKKSKLESKFGFALLFINLVEIIVLLIVSIFLVNNTSIPSFFRFDLFAYIVYAIGLLAIKKVVSPILSKHAKKISLSFFTVFLSLFIIFSCSMAYINGYNSNVVDAMCSEARVIENNKFIVFETTEHFYVIACEEKDDNSVKVYRDSYAFIEKENQNVIKKQYNNIYNEYDLSLSDARTNFTTVYW